jgi:hypothetical protein
MESEKIAGGWHWQDSRIKLSVSLGAKKSLEDDSIRRTE